MLTHSRFTKTYTVNIYQGKQSYIPWTEQQIGKSQLQILTILHLLIAS